MNELTKERGYVIWFDGDRARIRLATGLPIERMGQYVASVTESNGKHFVNTSRRDLHPPEYHVFAPSAQRAEQIARAMKGAKK